MSDSTPVSQFTLLASTKKGSKPDFHGALGGDEAKRLYDHFYQNVQRGYLADKVKNGVFQAMMEVALVNDGPVCPPGPGNSMCELTTSQVTLELSTAVKTPSAKPTPKSVTASESSSQA